jgi:adenine phosphoribosyltransferase
VPLRRDYEVSPDVNRSRDGADEVGGRERALIPPAKTCKPDQSCSDNGGVRARGRVRAIVLRIVDADLVAELRRRITFPDGHADIWPLFYDPILFRRVIDALAAPLRNEVTKIAGIESRGFLLGAAVATRLNVGFVAIRKQFGLFPGAKLSETADGDYRGNGHVLRLQSASCGSGDAVALVDDWSETGSQASAAKALIECTHARYVGASIVVDQLSERARDSLAPCHSIIAADLLG